LKIIFARKNQTKIKML